MILIFIGLPGSGKGTQASIFSKKYDFIHLSTGDLIRKEITKKSHLGLIIKDIVEAGGYVSDDIMMDLIAKHINNEKNYVLDGFPRTLNQAIKLDMIAKNCSNKIVGVVKFDINDKLIIERVSSRFTCVQCGQIYNKKSVKTDISDICNICHGTEFIHRADDDTDKLKGRIQNYYDLSEPVERFYQNRAILFTVSAHESTDNVSLEIELLIKQKNLLIYSNETL